jgi:membrane protein DedA with SNARE-associated domain
MTASAQLLALVFKYGYAAAFVGVLFEGESVLVLSGIAAHRGYLDLSILFMVGSSAAILTDNLFFALGRTLGARLLVHFPRGAPSVGRVQAVLARFPRTAVFAMRFLYGTRTIGPALLGAGTLSWRRFVALDVLAAAVWCACWLTAGYVVGEALEQSLNTLGDFRVHQGPLIDSARGYQTGQSPSLGRIPRSIPCWVRLGRPPVAPLRRSRP